MPFLATAVCAWKPNRLSPGRREAATEAQISERVPKLTCTSEDMLPLAEACAFTAGSFHRKYAGPSPVGTPPTAPTSPPNSVPPTSSSTAPPPMTPSTCYRRSTACKALCRGFQLSRNNAENTPKGRMNVHLCLIVEFCLRYTVAFVVSPTHPPPPACAGLLSQSDRTPKQAVFAEFR